MIQTILSNNKSSNLIIRLLTSGSITLLYRVFGLYLSFSITWFISNQYGASVYGNYSLVFTLFQASTMIFALGLPNAVINFLGLHQINDHYAQLLLKKGLKILFFPGVFVSVLLYFLKQHIAIDLFKNRDLIPYIQIIAITLPFAIFHEYILNFFIATKRFLEFNIFMFIIPNTLFLLFLLSFSIAKANEAWTILFYCIGICLTFTIELFFAFKKHKKTQAKSLSSLKIIQFSSPMMLSSLMLFLLNWTDIFMLGSMVSKSEVGIYNLAYKLASLAMLVIISLNVVLAPKISELYKSKKMVEMHSMVKKTTWVIISMTIPIVLFIIFFSEFIMGIFGHNFIEGKSALIIISIGVLINVMTGNVDQLLNMTDNQRILRNLTLVGFVLNVILNYILIPKFGINGAAIASLFTNIIFNVLCLLQVKRKLGFYTFI